MKLRFTPRAIQDITEIANFIRAKNPAAAERVRASILESLESLVLFPRIGRLQSEGVRKLVTPKYRYIVYYTVDEVFDEVIVLTARHPARERPFAKTAPTLSIATPTQHQTPSGPTAPSASPRTRTICLRSVGP